MLYFHVSSYDEAPVHRPLNTAHLEYFCRLEQQQAFPQRKLKRKGPSSSSSSSDEEARTGQAPDFEEKASTSGRSEKSEQGGRASEKKQAGIGSRLWQAYNVVKQEVRCI